MSLVSHRFRLASLPRVTRNIRLLWTRRRFRIGKVRIVTLTSLLLASSGVVYYLFANQQKKRLVRLSLNGIDRFLRSVKVGLLISFDYWWTLRGLQEVFCLINFTLLIIPSTSLSLSLIISSCLFRKAQSMMLRLINAISGQPIELLMEHC